MRVTAPVGVDRLRGGVVDRNLLPGRVHPFAEIALVHFGGGNRGGERGGADAVAEAFIGEEEEALVFAVVDLRDVNGTAEAAAEIALLVDRARECRPRC